MSNGQSITMFLQHNWHSLANSDGYTQRIHQNLLKNAIRRLLTLMKLFAISFESS